MATNSSRIYMCACCFIDYVKHTLGQQLEPGRDEEVWYIKALLDAAADKEIEVYTSTISIAECTHVGEEQISEEVKELFERLLTSGRHVTLIEPDVFVAEDARDLRWKHDIPLSGADAMHVASALSVKCQEFLTTDVKRKGPIHQAAKIAPLGLSIISPSKTGYISDERRQIAIAGMPDKPVKKKPKRH
jgi:predicted nucleic acid-binding protein